MSLGTYVNLGPSEDVVIKPIIPNPKPFVPLADVGPSVPPVVVKPEPVVPNEVKPPIVQVEDKKPPEIHLDERFDLSNIYFQNCFFKHCTVEPIFLFQR